MRFGRAMAAAVVLALVPACSSDSDANDLDLGTTVASTISVVSTTTTVTPTTTTTSTTEVATTTILPTTTSVEPSTTAAPEATDVSPTSVPLTPEEKVAADYEAARTARDACGIDPVSCDFAAVAVPGSPVDTATRGLMALRIANNLRAVLGQGEAKSRIDTVAIEGDSAFVTTCLFDTRVVFDVADPTNPNDDIVFNEERNSYRIRWEMRQADGRWLFFDRFDLQTLKGDDLCGF